MNAQSSSICSQQFTGSLKHYHFDITGTRLLRQRLLELGHNFVAAGVLQNAADVFSLSPDDVREVRNRIEGTEAAFVTA